MRFRGEHWYLSNMYPCDITYNGHHFTCVEAAFQAQKDLSRVSEFEGISGKDAKRLGRQVRLREGWNEMRDDIMKEILDVKFSDPELARKLASDQDIKRSGGVITEENEWGDRYWGVCNGVGRNRLGELLQEVRHEVCERLKEDTPVKKATGRDVPEDLLPSSRSDMTDQPNV